MASVLVIVLIVVVLGAALGGFLLVSFAIKRDDHDLGSLRYDARNHSARAARALTGVGSSGWGEG